MDSPDGRWVVFSAHFPVGGQALQADAQMPIILPGHEDLTPVALNPYMKPTPTPTPTAVSTTNKHGCSTFLLGKLLLWSIPCQARGELELNRIISTELTVTDEPRSKWGQQANRSISELQDFHLGLLPIHYKFLCRNVHRSLWWSQFSSPQPSTSRLRNLAGPHIANFLLQP